MNLCAYCARLAAVENSEVLALDAAEWAPSVWVVLTTRTATVETRPFYEARRQLQRAIQRRWPAAQYAALVEFTTGYGPHSGGLRRPHWNLLLKGIPVEALEELRELVERVWCARVDARPSGQYVGSIEEAGGLMRYLALHFQKESQAPPIGWRGTRFTHSRGYFPDGIAAVRARARRSLRLKRAERRIRLAAEAQGVELLADEVYELGERSVEVAESIAWELVRVRELAADGRGHELARMRHTAGRSAEAARRSREAEVAGSIPAVPTGRHDLVAEDGRARGTPQAV